jgi:hypothetical protein
MNRSDFLSGLKKTLSLHTYLIFGSDSRYVTIRNNSVKIFKS